MSRLKGLSAVEFAADVFDELDPEDDLELAFLATVTGASSLFTTAAVRADSSAGETVTVASPDVATSSFSSPSDDPAPLLEHPAHMSAPTSATDKPHIRLTQSPLVADASLGTM